MNYRNYENEPTPCAGEWVIFTRKWEYCLNVDSRKWNRNGFVSSKKWPIL